jgi:hypothetical protein
MMQLVPPFFTHALRAAASDIEPEAPIPVPYTPEFVVTLRAKDPQVFAPNSRVIEQFVVVASDLHPVKASASAAA